MRRRSLLAAIAGGIASMLGRGGASAQEPSPQQAEIEAARARTLAAFPYPRITVPGAVALAEWERLRREGKGWPVIVGDDEALDAIAEQFSIDDPAVFPFPAGAEFVPEPPRSTAEILDAAAKLKGPEALRGLRDAENEGELPWMPEAGAWPAPGTSGGTGLTTASDILSGKPYPSVHIVILPTGDSSEVPAYLRWGGWNACPLPEIQVAVLRDWKRRYGAELIGIDGDTINLRVTHRPASREEALALAHEQYLYCEDIVVQGVESLEALAALLMESDWWFFWWD